MKTIDLGNGTIVEAANSAYYFTTGKVPSAAELSGNIAGSVLEKPDPEYVGNFRFVPEGPENDLPYKMRDLLDDNYLGSGILNRITGLQLGQGIGLYQTVIKNDKQVREWQEDTQIQEWLDSWDADQYILATLVDFVYGRNYYSKMLTSKGAKISKANNILGVKGKIAALEHMDAPFCRREWPDNYGKIKRIITGDFTDMSSEFKVYPMIDRLKPLAKPVGIWWQAMPQYARSVVHPVIPHFYGARKWMLRSNMVPTIIENLTNNSLNIKWHIISPGQYWENRKEILKEQCRQKGTEFKESMLEKLKDNILKGLSNVLTGIDNVGKFFHSESVLQVLDIGKAELAEWKIIPIDMKVRDFIEAQIKVGNKADSATTSGMGLNPSLANIIVEAKMSGGSEQLYGYKTFVATETFLTEQMVFKALNFALRVNFPNTKLRAGFYREILEREEDVSPNDRVMANEN